MALDVKIVGYYDIIVDDHAVDGARLLSAVAGLGVNLLAFKAVRTEHMRTRFSLFPDDVSKMSDGAKRAGLKLDVPRFALLIKGDDDESGALAGIYERLSRADIDIIESSGIADVKGAYGVVLYMKQEDCEKAMELLQS